MTVRKRRPVLIVLGVVAILLGLLWVGQGLNVIGGSFMSGDTTWFVIGAVVALLGAEVGQHVGAQVYSVELIGISVMREFNILITAILLAGRSASSFAAASVCAMPGSTQRSPSSLNRSFSTLPPAAT